jgi:Fe-S cluster assembly protein SufD
MTMQALLDRPEIASLTGASNARQASADAARAHGWPTRADEAWHYTDLNARLKMFDLGLPRDRPDRAVSLPANDGSQIVFVNGRYSEAQSARLSFVSRYQPRSSTSGDPELPMVALNTAIATDGVSVNIPEHSDAGTVFLISIADVDDQAVISPRHRVTLGPNATLTLIETAQGHGDYLHNPVIEIELAEGAVLKHYRLQNESAGCVHVATIFARIQSGATYEFFTLSCGAAMSRTETHARLAGPEASVQLNAAQLLTGTQHGDVTSVISHDAPRCASRQTVKSVLAGTARGVFQGRIEVARPAQKTDGYQMNQALLLSPTAEIDCKPELEIFADDVKCSHGATIGALDPEQLFYLRSRGIAESDARAMLIRAFLDEAFEPVRNEAARQMFETAIDAWWQDQKAL